MSDPHAHDHGFGDDDKMHPAAKILFGWVGFKNIGNIIFYGLAILSVVLIVIDLMMSRHDKVDFASNYGFYAFYGFAAFSFVVLMGHPLGKLLRRDENYYGDLENEEEGQ